MHTSIFLQFEDFKTDPITEYHKISSFIKEKICYNYFTIYEILSEIFPNSKILRSQYTDLESCLSSIAKNLENNRLGCDEETLLEEYLNFCEVILSLSYLLIAKTEYHKRPNFNKTIFNQFFDLMKTGLLKQDYDYEIFDKDDCKIRIFKKNIEAEVVAAQSPKDIKEEIISYLSCRNNDLTKKKDSLHNLIDLLEPAFSKYSDGIVKEIREYAQLLRHLEKNKTQERYKWFYKNIDEYLDKLFSMCVMVQHYELTKKDINLFKENKKTNSES